MKLATRKIPRIGEVATGVVQSVEVKLASEIFGAKAKQPSQKKIICFGTVNGASKTERLCVLSAPETLNVKSSVVKICNMNGIEELSDDYHELVGLSIPVALNASGFWTVKF